MATRENTQKLISTAGLLLIDAMVFQEIISASHRQIPTLSTTKQSSNMKKELEDSWQYIIDNINYEPVLDIALRILRNMPASPMINRHLSPLVDLAYDIASSRVLLRHDLFGRIYHRLLLGKLVKYFATYYTSIPAARLLARLLINLPSDLNVEKIPPAYNGEPLRVVDFACGSGTLLSAIYKELDSKHRIASDEPDVDSLHRYLLEEGIWGFDVLHHAVHLASTVIALHDPVTVRSSKLFALRLGDEKYLGSLNFLSSSTLASDMRLSGEIGKGYGEKISVAKKESVGIKLPKYHICIMNPPFTRSVGGNLLFGNLPKEERKELQKYYSQVLREQNLTGIGQAGLGAAFVFLADKYLEKGGRMGFVLPRAVLSGVSWGKVRDTLLRDYHVEYVITSYEPPNAWNFSENTDLSEVLLVARKTLKEKKPHYTYFVNLKKKPSNELESIYLGTQLKRLYNGTKLYDVENLNTSPYYLKLNGRTIGEVYSSKLKENNFGTYNFFSQMELNRTILFLRKGIIYLPDQGIVGKVPLSTLSKLGAEIGPDVKQVHSIFKASDTPTDSVYKAFWGYDSSINKTIYQKPNASLEPKDAEKARELWKKRGKLLIAERAWLSTYTVLSTYLDEGVLSNVWWPVKLDDDHSSKILAVWLNSTFGILLLLSIAEVTRGPWVKFKKEHLKDMPIVDVNRLNARTKEALLSLYDKQIGNAKLCESELKSLPQEFSKPNIRKIIDDEICRCLGIDANPENLYKLLSSDSMLTC